MPGLEISPACMLFAVHLAHWSTSSGRGCLLKASGSIASCLPNQLCERVNLETPGSTGRRGLAHIKTALEKSERVVHASSSARAGTPRVKQWVAQMHSAPLVPGGPAVICRAGTVREAYLCSSGLGRDRGGHSSQPGWVLARRTVCERAPAWQ